MDRLTKHSKQTSHENGICCTHFFGFECLRVGGNCAMNCKWEEAAWSRLAAYENTGYAPEEIAKLQASLIMRNDELLKTREELKEHYDRIVGLKDALNSGLRAENAALAADRKALINELCQYCGKYKQAHEGACDGCRWREM
uniref:Uncharacterized protein n=1 Tax=Siphoviridae sp. ctBeL15 TaxID=2825374 RepID=A0A8S5V0B5_9CAUD|nr:MAG TPA: hypothetical protein [Siphoviridae sp. ctBeL15]